MTTGPGWSREAFSRPVLLINPAAGPRWRRRWLRPVIECLTARLPALKVEETSGPGTTTALVRRAVKNGCTLVISAGGDGTAHEVINGLVGSAVPLAVLPLGTGNALAREVGLSSHPLRACRQILAGSVMQVPLGETGGRYFVLAAGAGFDAYVLRRASRRAIGVIGGLAYLTTAAMAVTSYPYTRLTFYADGQKIVGTSGVIFKAKIPVGWLELMPRASLREPAFYLLVCTARTPAAYLGYGAALLCGRHLRLRTSRVVSARTIRVEADGNVPVHLDGEPVGRLPMTFTFGAATASLVGNPAACLPPAGADRLAVACFW